MEAFSFTPGSNWLALPIQPLRLDIFPAVVWSPTLVILYTISGGGQADLSRLPQRQHFWGGLSLREVVPHAGIVSVADILWYIIEFNELPWFWVIINPRGDVTWIFFFFFYFKCRGINLTFSYCNSESSTWTAHVTGPPAILLLINFLQMEQMWASGLLKSKYKPHVFADLCLCLTPLYQRKQCFFPC